MFYIFRFYRKDHLRKHTRSHIARRVKAEVSQHAPTQQGGEHSWGRNGGAHRSPDMMAFVSVARGAF